MNHVRRVLTRVLERGARMFAGRGLVDRYLPFMIPLYQRLYAGLQDQTVKFVDIPMDCVLAVSSTDIGIGLLLRIKGVYEPEQTRLFLESVQPGDTVWDIGANVGYYTVLAARKVGPDGRVIAFEADEENLRLLTRNVRSNECENVQIISAAVSDRIGEIAFISQRHTKGESAIAPDRDGGDARTRLVKCITLDSYASDTGTGPPSVVKMDIEGAEVMALEGAVTAFVGDRGINLFIEYNPPSIQKMGRQPKELLALIEQRGFVITQIVDETRQRVTAYSVHELASTMRHGTYCNLVCVRPGRG